MGSLGKIDFSKLLGFSSVSLISEEMDFRDETIAAKLGAKVGIEKETREIADRVEEAR